MAKFAFGDLYLWISDLEINGDLIVQMTRILMLTHPNFGVKSPEFWCQITRFLTKRSKSPDFW